MTMKPIILFCIFLSNTWILNGQDDDVTIKVDLDEAYRKGVELMNTNQYAEAYDYIFEVQRNDYKNIEYNNRLGYCLFKMGNYRDAKLTFESVLKKDSLNINALSNLATIADRELNYNAARQYYGQLIELDSTNSFYYRQSALIAKKRNDIISATAFFNKAHTLNEKDIATISDLATAYLELKAFDYAEQIIAKGMTLDSSNIRVLYTNARIKNAVDDYPAVIRSIEKAMSLGDSTNYYAMMIGVAHLKLDSLDQCIYHLNRVVARERDSEHTHHYLALAHELKEEFKKAQEHFEIAIEKGISKKIPRYHQDLAGLYEKSNKYYKAYENYKAAFDYKPSDELLFHIAHNADRYYKDKGIAMRYYKRYLKSGNKKYQEYSSKRVEQLKEINPPNEKIILLHALLPSLFSVGESNLQQKQIRQVYNLLT